MDFDHELVNAWAAMAQALVWPIVFVVTLFIYRNAIKSLLKGFPDIFRRLNKLDLPGGISAYLSGEKSDVNSLNSGQVTEKQIVESNKIAEKLTFSQAKQATSVMDDLINEYDKIRRDIPFSSQERTRILDGIVIKMRVLSASLVDRIGAYRNSVSPGARLAAVVIMQMEPLTVDTEWLVKRFSSEQPFIFYHAAIALERSFHYHADPARKLIWQAADDALNILSKFDGDADQNSLDVLEDILDLGIKYQYKR